MVDELDGLLIVFSWYASGQLFGLQLLDWPAWVWLIVLFLPLKSCFSLSSVLLMACSSTVFLGANPIWFACVLAIVLHRIIEMSTYKCLHCFQEHTYIFINDFGRCMLTISKIYCWSISWLPIYWYSFRVANFYAVLTLLRFINEQHNYMHTITP